MGQKVLILGDSGTGKSTSLRNFKPEEVLVINSANKPLPFKNHLEVKRTSFEKLTNDVLTAMRSTKKKVIVIDDAQYIMSFQYMRRIKENGWDKWNDIQGDFFNIIKEVDDLPDDVVVYFLSHLSRDDEGHEKVKTMGKMLDEKITIEGLFTVVLKTTVKDGQYYFLTQNSGLDTVKSPLGMFPTYAIDNDLKYVDEKIRNYYEIGDYVPDEVVAKHDEEVARAEVAKPDSDGRTRRRTRSTDKAETPEANKAAEPAETADDTPTSDSSTRRRSRRGNSDKGDADSGRAIDNNSTTDTTAEPAEPVQGSSVADEPPKRKRRAKVEKVEEPAKEEPAKEEKPRRRRKRSDTKEFTEDLPDWMKIDEDIEVPFGDDMKKDED